MTDFQGEERDIYTYLVTVDRRHQKVSAAIIATWMFIAC